MVQIAPYGSWKSPISTEMIITDAVGLADIALDGADIYWLEGRPKEGGGLYWLDLMLRVLELI